MIQAIETRYDGCHFRSRLEARWAVFFNELEIPWEYEAQGYEVDGRKYLPDFWLPDQGVWYEVKGEMPEETTVDFYVRFAEETGRPFIVAMGQINRVIFGVCDPIWGVAERNPCWAECETCGDLNVTTLLSHWQVSEEHCGKYVETSLIADALRAASEARFEHGQSGRGNR